MLTADLVRARRKGDQLVLSSLTGKTRDKALEVAGRLIEAAQHGQGMRRLELDETFQTAIQGAPKKLADGLRKLVEDRCEFEVSTDLSPPELRARVFQVAARARREATAEAPFCRDRVLDEQAAECGLSPEQLSESLYADLRSEQRLVSFSALSADQLLAHYETSQAQAVLLRAVEVVADVHCQSAYAYRQLFRKLKFHRLLHRALPSADGGYRLHIDGPFHLFTASTKYGLALALALPALTACDRYSLTASLRWGPEREPLHFKLEGKGVAPTGEEERLPDEVAALVERFEKLGSPWRVSVSSDILEVVGEGVCVPDLRFEQSETGEIVYLEVMGFWSRDAVFRRVELARAGLSSRVLFAVSQRLRVSESVLSAEEAPSELYVFKGALNAREVLRRLERSSV